MADLWAFLAAVEKPLDAALPSAPYAEAGTRALAAALEVAGYAPARQVPVFGSQVTLAGIRSRLRRMLAAARPGDGVVVALALRSAGDGLQPWDALADDLPETTLNLRNLVELLHTTSAARVLLLLDAGLSGAGHRLLSELLADSPKVVALSAAAADETSLTASALKASVWMHLVTEAFAGRAAKAIGPDGRVSALTLQRHIEDGLPRLLRRHFETTAEQTPQLYGAQNAADSVADLSEVSRRAVGGGLLSPERLRRVLFRAETPMRVKDLSGFRKTFSVPENASPANRKFIARLAADDIRHDLDLIVTTARDQLEYKRKDLDLIADGDGVGTLRTPDFEYTVSVNLDATDPSRVVWRRECGQFVDPRFVRSEGFAALFGKLFDQLVFEFVRPVDVAGLVDRLEDSPLQGVKLSVAADARSCDIAVAGFTGRVVVTESALTIRGRSGNAAGLLDQFLAFVSTVGPLGEPLALT